MKNLGGPASPSADVDRRQDAPIHWYQMGRERDDHLPPRGERELLVELCHVPVMTNAVRVKALRNFRKEHGLLGGAPCSSHPGLCIDDNFVEFNRLILNKRD